MSATDVTASTPTPAAAGSASTPASASAAAGSALRRLAGLELRRYARRPLFLIGVVLTAVSAAIPPDHDTSTFFNSIVPAAALGILGLVAMASLTRSAHVLRESAGVAPVPERTQTAALALGCLLPFAVGIAWFAVSVWGYHRHPPAPEGYPFGDMSTSWKWALLFGEGTMATLGGPLLGVVIGRWWPRRGVAPMLAVLLVAVVIVMQGLFDPLIRVRVVMPFTYWGGPDGNPEHWRILTGSPQWWVGYLACLCGLAVVGALWHDPGARGRLLRVAGLALLVAAVATCLLAMFTGVGDVLTNPLPS
ncbi:hypothetical protein [Frankia tisae]|uniref:hypothetical protein n=1 Tax=Frankia tisae TaxID=2950104 RepID=UPI0021BED272|nr:hypothetical protein [Frankia tisae]